MPIAPDTRKDRIRYAPGFGPTPPAVNVPQYPYTIDGLAKFLGEVGAGQITPDEMPVTPHTKPEHIRYAPGFSSTPPAVKTTEHPYTMDGLAKFLGEVGAGQIKPEEMPIARDTRKEYIRYAPGFGNLPGQHGRFRPYTIEALAKFLGEVGAGQITAAEMPIAPHTKPEHIRYAPGFSSTGLARKTEHPYTIEALAKFLGEVGAGQIKPEEMPIAKDTNKKFIRYAPGFGGAPPAVSLPQYPYTIDALAKFLGETDKDGQAHAGFIATFGALELIAEGYLRESPLKGLGTSLRSSFPTP